MQIPHEFFPVLIVQIGLFVALWMLLKRLWFDPALKIIRAREQRSSGALARAATLQSAAEKLRREHLAAIEQAKVAAQAEVQQILRKAETEQRRIIADANDAAQKTLGEARSRIAGEVVAARSALQAEVGTIAREVAKAVLGRAV